MRYYIGDKVLPKDYNGTKLLGIITGLSYDWLSEKPQNENDIEYSITWVSRKTKDLVPDRITKPYNSWWAYDELKPFQ